MVLFVLGEVVLYSFSLLVVLFLFMVSGYIIYGEYLI